ncbi:MAG: ribosomal protein L13e [Promethearchaeota archaeon]
MKAAKLGGKSEKLPVLVHSHDRRKPVRRTGRGFSRKEIEDAGLTIKIARHYGLPVDIRRSTGYPENVELLKKAWKEREEAELESIERAIAARSEPKPKPKKAAAGDGADAGVAAESPAQAGTAASTGWANDCPFCGKTFKNLARHKCQKIPEGEARYSIEYLPITAEQAGKLEDLGVTDLKALQDEDAGEIAGILKLDVAEVEAWIKYATTVNKMA